MNRSDRSSRVGWFTLSVVLGVMALALIPPFELFGMLTARVDLLSELRAESLADEAPMEYTADIERLEQELATMEVVDSAAIVDRLPEPPVTRYEWSLAAPATQEHRPLRSEEFAVDTTNHVIAIEDFDTLAHGKFDHFIEKLADERLKLWHYSSVMLGEMFVEAERTGVIPYPEEA